MRALKLWVVIASVLAASQMAGGCASRDPQENALLGQMAIPVDYQVTFEDPLGKPIPFSQFKAQMAGRPFDIVKDTARHRATLKLKSDDAIARSRATGGRSNISARA